MPALFALTLTVFLIGYLIRRDCKVTPHPSRAVWLPTFWLLINGSRQVSQWLATGGPQFSAQALEEGNVIDQAVYGALILAGIIILVRRRIRFDTLSKNNWWIILFFIFEGVSFVWSDFPFITLKRWIKASGDLVMVFLLCSDPHPVRAITATIKRSGYVLIPLSVLFCKYYQDLGRVIDDWGVSYYTGVTLDKNMLGYLLFAYGLFFAAGLVGAFRQQSNRTAMRADLLSWSLLLAMIAWLTTLANSKTSLLSLLLGIAVVFALQFAKVKRHLWSFVITIVIVGAISNALFSLKGEVLEAAGRDASLTGRTGIWETVLSEPNDPLLGTGYASFWLGERLQRIWKKYPNTPIIQAHNGYIEIYINLGVVGVALLGGMLWTSLRKARRRLASSQFASGNLDDNLFLTFGMAYILAYLVYNTTEATFAGVNPLFFIFLLLAFDFKRSRLRAGISNLNQVNGRRATLI